MDGTVPTDPTMEESAMIQETIRRYVVEVEQLREQMRRDQVEIERSRSRTKRALERVQAALVGGQAA